MDVTTRLRGATLADGRRVDVRIIDGRIAAITDAAGVRKTANEQQLDDHDLDGYLLVTAAVEPHAHLDKAFLADIVENVTGDLGGAIQAITAARGRLGRDDTISRAERAARLMAVNGFRAVRSHADVTTGNGVSSVEALVEVRRRVADMIDIQIVALVDNPVSGPAGDTIRALLHDAVAAGADVVGGCPHLESDGTLAATSTLLEIAAGYGVGVDLHTDETLDPAANGLGDLATLVTSTGFEHPVTASHCVSLGVRSTDDQRRIAEAVAAAGISVIALPATNLYLQGRAHPQATPRGVTAVGALGAAGVTVAAGADNLQDPFNPFGRACPFETAALMVLTTHLLPAAAWDCVTGSAAAAIGIEPQELAVGEPADLLAVPAASLREAMANGPADRIVWRAGRRQPRRSDPGR